MDAISDEVLVARSLEGDSTAFEMLVARYQTLVCSVAYAVTGDFARSEDVGQESLVQAWKQLSQLQDRGKFKSWICSIARNVAHNSDRSVARTRSSEIPDSLQDPGVSIEDRAMQNEEETLVWETLQRLPMNYREPMILYYRQDQSIAEVAESLDVSTDVVKQRLSRGRTMLRDEVTAVVERTLRRTVPSCAFTAAVLAAIPVFGAGNATAATTGAMATATAVKNVAGAGVLKSVGGVGAILGPLVGIAGGAVGVWSSWSMARYQSQRDLIVRCSIIYLTGMTIFAVPFFAMRLGWKPWAIHGPVAYTFMLMAWMGTFMILNGIWIFAVIRSHKELVSREQANHTTPLPETAPHRFLDRYEGRRWSSKRKLLGLPLIDIAFADRGYTARSVEPVIARGWIAVGDQAVGGLLAAGNIAWAPIAFGTMSIGLISCGVVAAGGISFGVVSIGGLAAGVAVLGGCSVGIVSLGYLSTGVVAVGWKAAKGVVAVAYHFSLGVQSFGQHAGDEAAKQWIENSQFLQTGDSLLRQSNGWITLPTVAVFVGAFLLLARLAYRRKPVDGATLYARPRLTCVAPTQHLDSAFQSASFVERQAAGDCVRLSQPPAACRKKKCSTPYQHAVHSVACPP